MHGGKLKSRWAMFFVIMSSKICKKNKKSPYSGLAYKGKEEGVAKPHFYAKQEFFYRNYSTFFGGAYVNH